MPDLGELGHVKEAEPITFGYFGERIRVNPGLSDVGIIRLVRRLGDIEKLDEIDDVLAAIDALVGALVHADDVEAFWTAAEKNGQDSDDLADTLGQIMEGVTARPTRRPSDSSDGSRSTKQRSGADSSSVVIDRYISQGRPDLALGVVRSVEARSA